MTSTFDTFYSNDLLEWYTKLYYQPTSTFNIAVRAPDISAVRIIVMYSRGVRSVSTLTLI